MIFPDGQSWLLARSILYLENIRGPRRRTRPHPNHGATSGSDDNTTALGRKSLTTILDETAWRRAIAGGDWGIICNLASVQLVSYVSFRTTEDLGDPFEIAPFSHA
ncbi:hypothetical protein BDV39DRAFT_142977 [Aspergillus sergii]|uniref:Uncharacterized protein n=1 Tax=Aspergillus sergii TaxID=1034303 RepID=A0A5N6WRE8_9EURO|nr:hypothetical protein BDV39DRAFT_142977 [Aspergillus sergii]